MKMNIIKRIKRKLFRKAIDKSACKDNFMYDFKCYFENCLDGHQDKDQLLARVMLTVHQLEKGLSFTESARIFGEEKALHIVKVLHQFIKKYGNHQVVSIATNVLKEYLDNPNSTKNEHARKTIIKFIDANKECLGLYKTGTKIVSKPQEFQVEDIKNFFFSRSSVREYSDDPITDEEIKNVMEFATCTPTACNRQTSRVHVFRNKDAMSKLIENQLGNQNWCDNATAIFVITTNISYFNSSYEHVQAFIDGGLFAMNFDWGLHLYHIASCYKMYVRLPEIDKEFHELSGIPENEFPIVLILAGHYKEEPIVSPKSVRLPVVEGYNLFLHN